MYFFYFARKLGLMNYDQCCLYLFGKFGKITCWQASSPIRSLTPPPHPGGFVSYTEYWVCRVVSHTHTHTHTHIRSMQIMLLFFEDVAILIALYYFSRLLLNNKRKRNAHRISVVYYFRLSRNICHFVPLCSLDLTMNWLNRALWICGQLFSRWNV